MKSIIKTFDLPLDEIDSDYVFDLLNPFADRCGIVEVEFDIDCYPWQPGTLLDPPEGGFEVTEINLASKDELYPIDDRDVLDYLKGYFDKELSDAYWGAQER